MASQNCSWECLNAYFIHEAFINRSKKSAAWWSAKSRSVGARQRFKFRLCHALAVLTFAVKWRQSHLLTGYWLKPQVGKALCLVPGTGSGYQWQVTVIIITWWCPLTHLVGLRSSRLPLSKDSERWASHSSDFPGIFISVQAIHSTIIRLFIQQHEWIRKYKFFNTLSI